jgi:hypothetical protein
MAITNFITSVWSETLLNSLEKEYVAVRNCNREFEGEIKAKGDSVKVCAVSSVSIFSYHKNMDLQDPQVLDDKAVRLSADISRAFNFQIDDIDKAQSAPGIMKSAMRQAASALANDADAYIYRLYSDEAVKHTVTNEQVTPENIIDTIISLREKMLANNINSNTETVLEVSPAIASIILKAQIAKLGNNADAMYNGYIGSCIGFDIYVSNNISESDGFYKCFARTKRAIAFAEKIKSIVAYRPENRFADAIKGLYLYGAKVIYPDELIIADLRIGA